MDEGFGLGEGAGGDVGLGDVELDAEVGFVVVEGEEVGGGVVDVVADQDEGIVRGGGWRRGGFHGGEGGKRRWLFSKREDCSSGEPERV